MTTHRLIPTWRWIAGFIAFPIAGLLGGAAAGPVDTAATALLGGAVTGIVLGVGQWLAAGRALAPPAAWIAATGAGYALGLTAGASIVGFGTELGDLALMGAVTGAGVGLAQGAALTAHGRRALAAVWAPAMPVLMALGWTVTTLAGVDVEVQYTVFGATGALVFVALSGLLLARAGRGDARTSALADDLAGA